MRFPWKQAVFTGVCVAILISLGTWQVQRLHWKEGLIARLDADYAASAGGAPMPLARLQSLSQEKDPIAAGSLQGRLLIDKAVLVGPRSEDGRMGYTLVLPLQLEHDGVLLLNAGWVSDLWKDNTEGRLAVLPRGTVTARGVIRKPDYNRFASRNNPENDLWFTISPGDVAAAKDLRNVYPVVLYADTIDPPLADVTPNESGWRPRNKHLQYALFWYALAVAMCGVFGVYTAQRMKK